MTSSSKQYGLIMPKKKFNIAEVKRPSIFNNNSDSDEGAKDMGTSDWIKKSFQKQAAQNSGVRRQTEIDMKKALEQDPTVYKYDEIYDEMEKKKLTEEKKKNDDKKKPRYIQSLLKKAEQRKIENERRIERQVQKEREAEGEEFKDKETFVTSSYRKKLEEFSKLDEEERRQEMLEDICDVSKQQDLTGFYRHLYKTVVDEDNSETKKSIKKLNSTVEGKEESKDDIVDKLNTDTKKQKEKRQYRKRKVSETSSLEEGERSADSDTSISSSSSSSSSSSAAEPNDNTKEAITKEIPSKPKQIKTDGDNDDGKEIPSIIEDKSNENIKSNKKDNPPNTNNENTKENSELKDLVKEKKTKVNVWRKRTVGPVFEAALKRYFERKAERQVMRCN